ncbi:site-specific integrase [Ferrimonas sp. YFM]|uniref:tyrosine-type recombinase/integrase n=1 Tax=Ferrimonas sp. YFM TaxID=3028878 RepID=UPI0025747D0C|nr:site-specific integrase [Ferrimonas sp. YFM]BDY07068.1 transposase [Ferrimonas sp. YFM]
MGVEILNGVQVRIGVASEMRAPTQSLEMDGTSRVVVVPVIIKVPDKRLSDLVNRFILKKATDGTKDLMPTAKALRTWLSWIFSQGIDPLSYSIYKYKSPTYSFRQHLLQRANKDKNISLSTANNYILVVKSFYKMLEDEGIVESDLFYKPEVSIVDGYRKVPSSDLSIRVPRGKEKKLSPLTEAEQQFVIASLSEMTTEFTLIILLMMHSGLRLNEALTMNAALFSEGQRIDKTTYLITGVKIGPKYGVSTKFSTERELFLSNCLHQLILYHKSSEAYQNRLDKWRTKSKVVSNRIPLFLSSRGNEMTSGTFYTMWYKFIAKYKKNNNRDLCKRPHDLRATFGTNYLSSALRLFPNDVDACLESTKHYMGHKDIKTTLHYINFLSRKCISEQVAQVMDELVFSSMEVSAL